MRSSTLPVLLRDKSSASASRAFASGSTSEACGLIRPSAHQRSNWSRQARTRAGKYAELAGARLGEVQSVEELEAATDESNPTWTSYQYQGPGGVYYATTAAAGGGGRLTSTSLAEIPVRVTLRVRFELLPPAAGQK